MRKCLLYSILILCVWVFFNPAHSGQSADSPPNGLTGDIGIAVFSQNAITKGNASSTQILPYAYFDYDRFFARIDTFGIKTIPIGYGYLEVVGKYNSEGYAPKGTPYNLLNQRDTPIPLGLGTFQLTPFGAFFVHAYQDATASKGLMGEYTYAAQVELPMSVKLYPLIGFDYKDKRYLNYFYGVSSVESLRSGVSAYSTSDGSSPFAAFVIEVPLNEHWIINTLIKQKWLASTIVNSPLVNERHLNNAFISLNYHFE